MSALFPDFSYVEIVLTGLLFLWAGFVRSGLGFGGAALALPLMLFIFDQPLYWLPIIGAHLLFFSATTLRTRLHNVDWAYLKKASVYVVPTAIVGVLGLINLPKVWLLYFIYGITLFYSIIWMLNLKIHSEKSWSDKLLLMLGGYVAGTSLSGAPLMVAVFMRNISREKLRNTMFVLWFVLVSIKMGTFITFSVDLHLFTALVLLPVAAIGHVVGLRFHEKILQNDITFKRVIGAFLFVVSLIGIVHT